jgi:tetratricopeptide (TPR) repeat protein
MMEDGLRLNPDAPNMRHIYTFMARAYIKVQRHKKAAELARRGIEVNPDNPNAFYLLASSLGHLGDTEAAELALNQCEDIQPGFVADRAEWSPYDESVYNEYILEGVCKAASKD